MTAIARSQFSGIKLRLAFGSARLPLPRAGAGQLGHRPAARAQRRRCRPSLAYVPCLPIAAGLGDTGFEVGFVLGRRYNQIVLSAAVCASIPTLFCIVKWLFFVSAALLELLRRWGTAAPPCGALRRRAWALLVHGLGGSGAFQCLYPRPSLVAAGHLPLPLRRLT